MQQMVFILGKHSTVTMFHQTRLRSTENPNPGAPDHPDPTPRLHPPPPLQHRQLHPHGSSREAPPEARMTPRTAGVARRAVGWESSKQRRFRGHKGGTETARVGRRGSSSSSGSAAAHSAAPVAGPAPAASSPPARRSGCCCYSPTPSSSRGSIPPPPLDQDVIKLSIY